MIGDAVLYAASRATHTAIENVSRRITWTVIACVFFLTALILGILAAYLMLEPELGKLGAVAALAGVFALLGALAISVPWMVDRFEQYRHDQNTTAQNIAQAVDEEARNAVDYFGAMQTVATAFLFGLGAARRLRR